MFDHIYILDYVNRIGNGCMFAKTTPLLVGTEMSILTCSFHLGADCPHEIGVVAAGRTSIQADFGDKDDCPVG